MESISSACAGEVLVFLEEHRKPVEKHLGCHVCSEIEGVIACKGRRPIDIGNWSDELCRDRLLYYRCFHLIEALAIGIQKLFPCFGPVIEGEEEVQGALDLCWLAKPFESGRRNATRCRPPLASSA